MIIGNRRTFVPVFIWALLCIGLFLLALVQQRTSIDAVPFLTLQNAFGWISSLLLVYFIFIWPLSHEGLVDRFARQLQTQGTFSTHAVQEPGLLVLYVLPVLILSAAFGFNGFIEIAQTIAILFIVGLATWAHFRLGFFFHGSMAKSYLFIAGVLCILIPGLNVVFPVFYEEGPAWLNHLNPFFVIFKVAGPGEGLRGPFVTLFLTFVGLTVVLLGVPFIMALSPRVYRDLPGA